MMNQPEKIEPQMKDRVVMAHHAVFSRNARDALRTHDEAMTSRMADDLAAIINPSGGSGHIEGSESVVVQNEAVAETHKADDLAAIINPSGERERASRHVDRGESAVVQNEAVQTPDSQIIADDLTAIIDPKGSRGRAAGNVNSSESAVVEKKAVESA